MSIGLLAFLASCPGAGGDTDTPEPSLTYTEITATFGMDQDVASSEPVWTDKPTGAISYSIKGPDGSRLNVTPTVGADGVVTVPKEAHAASEEWTVSAEVEGSTYTAKITITVELQEYTVAFESNGGSAVPSQQVETGGKAQAPDDPVKENKYFAGWYSDSTFNSPYEFNKFTLMEDITLYAKWDDLIDISTGYTIVVQDTTATAGAASVLRLTVEKSNMPLSADDYTLVITARPAGASADAFTINAAGQIAVADTITSADAGEYTLEALGKNAYTGTVQGTFTLTVNTSTVKNSVDSVTIKGGTQDAPSAVTNEYGTVLALTAVVAVTGTPADTVDWNSSDGTVATVQAAASGNGVTITPTGLGTTTITATSTVDSSVKDTIVLTVTEKIISHVTLQYAPLTIEEGSISGNTADPIYDAFLVGGDSLSDAVGFTLTKVNGLGPEPGTDVTINADTGVITIASTQTAFTATQYKVSMNGKGKYSGTSEQDITLTVNAMAVYGTPASITEVENQNPVFSLSWNEFDNDDSTVYAVYAYNLSIRTVAGGTAPELATFLTGKTTVEDVTRDMSPVELCSNLTEPNTPAGKDFSNLYLFPGHKYVFVVTGTRGGSVLTASIAAGIIDVAQPSSNPGYIYVNSSGDGTQFHAAIIDNNYTAWDEAAKAAKAQGGGTTLAEINNAAEQTQAQGAVDLLIAGGMGDQLNPSSDGGGARYLWIGATDEITEGTWIWDGDYDGVFTSLGEGNVATNWAGDEYHNWGYASGAQREPDDWGRGQDYAAIAIGAWQNGAEYQWNDIAGPNNGYLLEAQKHW